MTSKNISQDLVNCSFSESEAPHLSSIPLVLESHQMTSQCRGRGLDTRYSTGRRSGRDFDISERTPTKIIGG